MPDQRVKVTDREYLQMPEEQRWERLEGDLRMEPASHNRMAAVYLRKWNPPRQPAS